MFKLKIRSDFVTNSSSSSFIISTKQPIPKGYEDSVKTVTRDNVASILAEPYEYDTISNNDELLQEYAGLTNEQMSIVKLAVEGELKSYIEILNRLDGHDNIYNIYEDRDWLYNQTQLENFIYSSEVLDKKTDL